MRPHGHGVAQPAAHRCALGGCPPRSNGRLCTADSKPASGRGNRLEAGWGGDGVTGRLCEGAGRGRGVQRRRRGGAQRRGGEGAVPRLGGGWGCWGGDGRRDSSVLNAAACGAVLAVSGAGRAGARHSQGVARPALHRRFETGVWQGKPARSRLGGWAVTQSSGSPSPSAALCCRRDEIGGSAAVGWLWFPLPTLAGSLAGLGLGTPRALPCRRCAHCRKVVVDRPDMSSLAKAAVTNRTGAGRWGRHPVRAECTIVNNAVLPVYRVCRPGCDDIRLSPKYGTFVRWKSGFSPVYLYRFCVSACRF